MVLIHVCIVGSSVLKKRIEPVSLIDRTIDRDLFDLGLIRFGSVQSLNCESVTFFCSVTSPVFKILVGRTLRRESMSIDDLDKLP